MTSDAGTGHAQRLTAQLLAGPPASRVIDVVERILAVQAQDVRGARLAVRSRSTALTVADVDAELDAGRLIITWLNRGTLHLVRPDDYWWLHPLTTPQLATNSRRRLAEEGVSPDQAERGVEVVVESVRADGPLTRAQLKDRLDDAGVPTARQALVHVLMATSLRGHVVRGPLRDGQHAYVLVDEWLGAPPAGLDEADALEQLARRYLVGHGPAEPEDLARWAGITIGRARRAFAAASDAVDAAARRTAAPLPPPRLLGQYDPVLHGWASRADVVGEHRSIVTSNGLFRAFAMVGGRAVATWGLDGGRVTLRLLEPVGADDVDALRTDGIDVLRFLGLPPSEIDVVQPL